MCETAGVRALGVVLLVAMCASLYSVPAARRGVPTQRVPRALPRFPDAISTGGRRLASPSWTTTDRAVFRSSLRLQVFRIEPGTDDTKDWLGTTPAAQGIPVHGVWGVEARAKMPLRALVAAVRGTGIRALSLDDCVFEIADLALLSELPDLEWLDCDGRGVGGVALAHIGRLPALRYLDLRGVRLNDGDLAHLAGLSVLETLDLTQTSVGDEAMRHIAALPRLERVLLWQIGLSAAGFRHLFDAPRLRSLKLGGGLLDSAALVGLAGHPTLAALEFRHQNDFTPETLGHLRDLPALAKLDFRYCDQDTGEKYGGDFNVEGLYQIGSIAGLRFLGLRNTGLTDAGLARLTSLRDIEELRIENAEVTDAGLQQLRFFPRLKILTLSDVDISDAGMRVFRELPDLVELQLFDRNRVTDIGLRHLPAGLELLSVHGDGIRRPDFARFSALRRLWLWGSRLEDAGLASVADLTALVSLDLCETRVTSAGLSYLRRLRSLRDLDLSNTRVDDEGLAHLRELSNLDSLELEATRVTGPGLRHLAGLSALRTLDLSRTKITDGALADLPPNLDTLALCNTPITAAALPRVRRLKRLSRLFVSNTAFPRVKRIGFCDVERLR